MKAPDKIYLTTSAENKKYGNNWGCWTTRECPGEPYIRKEALLKYVKDRLAQYDSEYTNAGKELQMIIDKINSL